jgi:hypothetical protein
MCRKLPLALATIQYKPCDWSIRFAFIDRSPGVQTIYVDALMVVECGANKSKVPTANKLFCSKSSGADEPFPIFEVKSRRLAQLQCVKRFWEHSSHVTLGSCHLHVQVMTHILLVWYFLITKLTHIWDQLFSESAPSFPMCQLCTHAWMYAVCTLWPLGLTLKEFGQYRYGRRRVRVEVKNNWFPSL